MKYWIIVATQEHVARGVAEGIAQIGHGKRAPLTRLQLDDWIIYYSPQVSLSTKTPVQSFTAIGQVKDEDIFKVTVTPEFQPYRRRINYLGSQVTPIQPLIEQLKFIRDKKNWGYTLHFGLIGIPKEDFLLIQETMIPTPFASQAINIE